jgi:phage tail-like protein
MADWASTIAQARKQQEASRETAMPVAFHFGVSIRGPNLDMPDAAFREVSGLDAELDIEEVYEGGQNEFVHRLPKGRRQGNLRLTRGLALRQDPLVAWCQEILDGGLVREVRTATVMVKLLNADHAPVAAWAAENCWPVKWQIGAFDAMANKLAVETLELCYTALKRTM